MITDAYGNAIVWSAGAWPGALRKSTPSAAQMASVANPQEHGLKSLKLS